MDTIAAVATGSERSAIGVVRLSGDGAIRIAKAVFRRKGGEMRPKRLYFGEIINSDGEAIDRCLCTVSFAPSSYTGEDTAEFQCHGSPVVLSEVLRTLFKLGARQAEPGEFTKRAFLNGKLDLTGAEAVADLIDAESVPAAKAAARQLGGAIFQRVDAIYSALIGMMGNFQAAIDFPDDEIPEFELEATRAQLESAHIELSKLAESFEKGGKYLKRGVPAALIGRPNVGKSSILNRLLGYDRAIVTAKAGTTRDTIEEIAVVGGVTLRLTDTAGIRDTEDEIEREGVLRSRRAAEAAALVIGVFDGSEELTSEDKAVLAQLAGAEKAAALINKSDVERVLALTLPENVPCFAVSAKTGEGFDALGEYLSREFSPKGGMEALITNERQFEAISSARDTAAEALTAIGAGATPDAVLTLVEDAAGAVGRLTGRTVTDDVVHDIFSRFCVGK